MAFGHRIVNSQGEKLNPQPTFVLTHLDAGQPGLGIENAVLADDFARFSL